MLPCLRLRPPIPAVVAALITVSTAGALLSAARSASGQSVHRGVENGRYPVTIANCGTKTTYDHAPRRAVTETVGTLDMLALGLGSKLVGANVSGDVPVGQPPVPVQYMAAFKKVHRVPNDFTLESLVALRPDFYFAGYDYGLEVGTQLTPAGLAKYGIKTLALTESCAHVDSSVDAVSMTDVYEDLRNLGEIFGVESRARALIDSLEHTVAQVQRRVTGLKPVTVFDYDSGQASPLTGPGLAMPTALISLGGGTNIFAELKQTWTTVTWEQVIAANPQCILINNYTRPTAAQKEKFLETNQNSKNLPAVKRRCFLALPYDEVTPSPLDAQAVVSIARWLHPAAFGVPADGS